MKKLALLTLAFAASAMAFAQTNLALNKPAEASSISDENSGFTAAMAVDGNKETKWASNYDTKNTLGEAYDKDAQWIYVDLGESTTINTVKILVDNQPASEFDIRVADVISDNDPTTSGNAVLTAQSSNGGENTYKFEAATGRYVIIDFKKRATGWGYGIFELEIYNIDYSVRNLTTFTAYPSFVKSNVETELTMTTLDQNKENLTDGVTYEVTNGTLDGNKLTATAAGIVTVTAKYGNDTKTVNLYALDDSNAPAAPAEGSVVLPVYSNTNTDYNADASWQTDWNGGAARGEELTLNGQVMMPFDDVACVTIGNRKAPFNGETINFNPSATDDDWDVNTLHMDIFTNTDATGSIKFEGTGITDYPLTTKGGEWTSVDIDVKDATNLHVIALWLDAIDGVKPGAIIANVYFTKKAGDEPQPGNSVLTTFTLPKFGILADGTANISVSLLDNSGNAYTGDVEYTISEGATIEANEDGSISITAPEANVYTVTVTATAEGEENVVLTQDITLINGTAAAPTDEEVYAIYCDTYDAKKVDEVIPENYFKGYRSAEEIAMCEDDNTYYVDGAGSFGMRRGTPTTSEYSSLKFDIYAFEDIIGTVQLRNGRDVNATPVILPEQTIQLKGGQWNHIEVSLADAAKTETVDGETVATTIGFIVWTCQATGFHNLFIDNVYLSKAEAEIPEIGLTVVHDSETACTFAGKANSAEELNEAMNDVNVTYYDFTGLELADGITAITPANPNALILVAKSKEEAETILTETDNIIYKEGEAEWLYPVRQLVIDGNYPTYNGHMISTGNAAGYKYTRSLTAGKYVTLSLHVAIAVPEGTKAYELYGYADNTVTFNEVEAIAADTPYILYAEEDAEIVAEGYGDVLKSEFNTTVEKNGITFHTNNVEFTATGAEYGLQNATDASSVVFKNVVAPARIGAFRAYFTFDGTSSAKEMKLVFNDNATTGISNVTARDAKTTGMIYGIDGKLINANGSIEHLAKGLYIIDGKKVVIK